MKISSKSHKCFGEGCPFCERGLLDPVFRRKSPSQGVRRTVYLWHEYVIKLDPGNSGEWHDDLGTWEDIQADWPEYAEYFVPTLAQGDGWSIQPFVKFTHCRELDYNTAQALWEDELEDIVDALELHDIWDTGNWGIREDGSLVIFDYGG